MKREISPEQQEYRKKFREFAAKYGKYSKEATAMCFEAREAAFVAYEEIAEYVYKQNLRYDAETPEIQALLQARWNAHEDWWDWYCGRVEV